MPKGMMIVLNSVTNDSRVVKMAAAMSRIYDPFVLIGVYSGVDESAENFHVETIAGIKCYKFARYATLVSPVAGETAEEHAARKWRASVTSLQQKICSFARRFDPDCVHTHDMFTLPMGRAIKENAASNRKEISWIHDVHEFAAGSSHMPPLLQEYALQLEREHLPYADRVVTVSPELRARLLDLYPDLQDVRVIYNAPQVFPPTADSHVTIRDALRIGTSPLAVYSGVVKAKRGVERMIPVLQEMPELHFAVLTGSEKSIFVREMKKVAEDAGLADRMHWHPYVPPTEVVRFLRGADIGVIPIENYGNAEVALPNKLFEYCFAGMPVVSHDLDAISSFFDRHPVGLAVDFDNPAVVATAIQKVLEDAFRMKLGVIKSELQREYSWETQERRLLGLYREISGMHAVRVVDPVSGIGETLTGLRIFHGITGAAGQPAAMVKALNRIEGVSARNLDVSASTFRYPADLTFPLKANTVENLQALLRSVSDSFDIFHMHYRGFFHDPAEVAFPTGMDLLLLKAMGKGVVMHFRGSEVRLQSVFSAMNPYHYVDEDPERTVSLYPEPQKKMFISLASAIADKVFVTDPELATYVPGAEIIERAIDLSDWPFVGVNETDRPLVLHAPSRRGVKGTKHVLAAVERLKARGVKFDFQLVEGLPNTEARKLYERADIIVDQLRIGWHGVLAVEAMALGKPVIAYIRDDLVHHLGDQPPLAIANPDTIEFVLERLINSADERSVLSRRARSYCEAVHASDRIAAKLLGHYRQIRSNPRPVDANIVLDHLLRQHIQVKSRGAGTSAIGLSAQTMKKRAYTNWQRVQYLTQIARHQGVGAAYKLVAKRILTRLS